MCEAQKSKKLPIFFGSFYVLVTKVALSSHNGAVFCRVATEVLQIVQCSTEHSECLHKNQPELVRMMDDIAQNDIRGKPQNH